MKTVENLKPGETLLRAVRVYEDGSYGIEICEMRKNQPINVAALLNKSDDRFKQSQPKAMRAWTRVNSPVELQEYFNIDTTTLQFTEKDSQGNDLAIVNILNPKIEGQRLVVQTEDSLVPVDGKKTYQVKKFGVDTDNVTIPTFGGKPIFSRRSVTSEGALSNTIIRKDGSITEAEYEAMVKSVGEEAMTEG